MPRRHFCVYVLFIIIYLIQVIQNGRTIIEAIVNQFRNILAV